MLDCFLVVIGASEIECESVEEVMACLEQGSLYRHTGSTQMNEQSSRSHTIFTIFIGKLLRILVQEQTHEFFTTVIIDSFMYYKSK